MNCRVLRADLLSLWAVTCVFAFVMSVPDGLAQRGGNGQSPGARAAAPVNLDGYWVAQVNEDWRHRMFTAQRGDYDLVRLNGDGRRMADSWEFEERPGGPDNCLMAYGAAGVMRLPTRLNIHWSDDNTLQVDLDAGTQTREFFFGESGAPGGQPTRQGYSVAEWETSGGGSGGASLSDIPLGGHLKVVTTNMLPGFYFKNGIPYSEDAVMTEFFVPIVESDGSQYLLVQTFVQDPTYLAQAFVRTLTFKKEPDGSKWSPTPCTEY